MNVGGCIASVNKRGQQLHLYKFKASCNNTVPGLA